VEMFSYFQGDMKPALKCHLFSRIGTSGERTRPAMKLRFESQEAFQQKFIKL